MRHLNLKRLCFLGLLTVALTGCGGDEVAEAELDGEASATPESLVEVELGQFFVTRRVSDGEMAYIQFTLFAVVDEEKKDDFEVLLGDRRERMRERISQSLQEAKLDQIEQPSRKILKTELTLELKKVLHTPDVYDVAFTEYSVQRG